MLRDTKRSEERRKGRGLSLVEINDVEILGTVAGKDNATRGVMLSICTRGCE